MSSMVVENLAGLEQYFGASVYLQLSLFVVTFVAGLVLTKTVLVPAISYITLKRSDSKKLQQQSRSLTGVLGVFLSFLAALQAGQFGNLVTVIGVIGAALTVAIGFGMREQVANLVAGILIHVENPYVKGDYVKMGDQEGVVKEIGMRATVLDGKNTERNSVPNGVIANTPLKNYTRGVKTKGTAEVKVDSAETPEAEEILIHVAEEHQEILQSPAPFVRYKSLEENKTVMELSFWIKDSQNPRKFRSDILKEFNARAAKEGIFDEDKDNEETTEESP